MRTLGIIFIAFGTGALLSAIVAYEHGYAAGRLEAFRQFYRERELHPAAKCPTCGLGVRNIIALRQCPDPLHMKAQADA